MKHFKNIGFTLLELLVVISVVLIIASFVIPNFRSAKKSGLVKKAKTDILRLENAISLYESDFGVCPPAATNKALVNFLTSKTLYGSSKRWQGPYIQFQPSELKGGAFIDPWGTPYVYRCPGVFNKTFVDIYSFGPDGVNNGGGKDDINNWSRW